MSHSQFDDQAIAVIGIAGRFPKARTPDQFWQRLIEGHECSTQLSADDLRQAGVEEELINHQDYVASGAFLEDMECFDAGFFGLSPRDASIMDPQHRQLLEVAWEALENAGIIPDAYHGSIGVFAGSGYNRYLASNVLPHRDLLEQFGFFLLRHTGNDKDFLSTRISYELGLTGPSVNVQTACSTSLVAVHMACQSLLAGECDVALSGAVSIDLPHRRGYLYREGEVASPDGKCRPFSHDANGTYFGSGAGIVVLKPALQAKEDGDYIHAIVRGTATNNDGSAKISYLAPSVDAQANVIAEALAVAGVEPSTVSYVETHGTGTPMGDPIEFAALQQVYGAAHQHHPCDIGSVKGNIGHLDTAAGVAGLIKTIEALKHQKIPSSLNFNGPNPALELDNSGLRVCSTAKSWESAQSPRRAGVTSLGVGGTNAHVVLEEYQRQQYSVDAVATANILPISAKTPSALKRSITQLHDYCKAAHDTSVMNIAHTLQHGRRAFDYRAFVIASSREELESQLSALQALEVNATAANNITPCFMFAGGGAQYQGMGYDLYKTEPVYRECIDQCLAVLDARDRQRVHAVLCTPAIPTADQPFNTQFLSEPSTALPALFATQLAQARLLQSHGIQPEAVIGHSMGEYTAACIAGVFDLPTALAIVVKRAALFEQLAQGAMLSVLATEREIIALLPASLSIAAVNTPGLCVVSGELEAIAAFEHVLDSQGIDARRVPIAVAAHSAMLDPILSEFRCFMETVSFSTPKLAIISNLTGDWATEKQLCTADYWVKHLRDTVRFESGIKTLTARCENSVLIEVGPGSILSNMLSSGDWYNSSARQPVASMRRENEDVDDKAYLLSVLGTLWSFGVSIDWHSLGHELQQAATVPLPTYPFERERHWLDEKSHDITHTAAGATEAAIQTTFNNSTIHSQPDAGWFAVPHWHLYSLPPATQNLPASVIVIDYAAGLGERVAHHYSVRGVKTHHIIPSSRGVDVSQTGSANQSNYHSELQVLIESINTQHSAAEPQELQILHFLNVDMPIADHEAGLDFSLKEGKHRQQHVVNADIAIQRYFEVSNLVQMLGELDQPIRLYLFTDNMQQIGGEEVVKPEKALLLGLIKVVKEEIPLVNCTSVDIQLPINGRVASTQAKHITEALLRQWQCKDRSNLSAKDDPVSSIQALRQGQWYIPELESITPQPPYQSITPSKSEPAVPVVSLITGGLGGMGYTLARYLATTSHNRMILLGRSCLPPTTQYQDWLDRNDSSDPTSINIRKLLALEALGADVLYLNADVSDLPSLRVAVNTALDNFAAITHVYHTAGVLNDGLLCLRSHDDALHTFAPKFQGTLNLDSALHNQPLELMVLFSSTSAHLGLAGQTDYSAANAFLNAFARYKFLKEGTPTLAIAWDRWEQVGMAAHINESARTNTSNSPVTPRQIIHPLFDSYTFSLETKRPVYTFDVTLNGTRHWLLDGHRLKSGASLLPGTAYLQFISAALEVIRGNRIQPDCNVSLQVDDMLLAAPCELDDLAQRTLTIQLVAEPDEHANRNGNHDSDGSADENNRSTKINDDVPRYCICISSHPTNNPQENHVTQHVSCTAWVLQQTSTIAPTPVDKRIFNDSNAVDAEFYDHPLIEFGDRWHCVKNISYQSEQAWVHLQLSPAYVGELSAWTLHPALLDMALGAAYRLLPDNETKVYVPSSYGRIHIASALSAELFSHIQLANMPQQDDTFVLLTIRIVDAEGRDVIKVDDFCLQQLQPSITHSLMVNHSDASTGCTDVNSRAACGTSFQSLGLPVFLERDLPPQRGIKPHEGIQALIKLLSMDTLNEVLVSPRLAFNNRWLRQNQPTRYARSDHDSSEISHQQSDRNADKPQLTNADEVPLKTRKSLGLGNEYVSPQTELQQSIAEIWQNMLGVQDIGVHDDFFNLGGHSLLLTQSLAQVKKMSGKRLSLQKALSQPTVSQWAVLLDEQHVHVSAVPAKVDRSASIPLPPGPYRFLHHRGVNGQNQWNIALVLKAKNPINLQAMRDAVRKIYERHDALQMRFNQESDHWESIISTFDECKAVDSCELPSKQESATALLKADANQLQESLSLQTGHLLRVRVYSSKEWEQERVLIFVHHLVHDAYSWNLLLNKLQRFYKLRTAGNDLSGIDGAPIPYSAWAAGLSSLAQQWNTPDKRSYWQNLPWSSCGWLPHEPANGAQQSTDNGDALPTTDNVDRSDHWFKYINTNSSSREYALYFDESDTAILIDYVKALEHEVTMNEVLLLVLSRALAELSSSSHVLVDVMQLGREDSTELDLSSSLGFFVSYTPVLVEASADMPLDDVILPRCLGNREMQERNIEHDVLRFVSADEAISTMMNALPRAEVLFNYLGQRDESGERLIDDSLFSLCEESAGNTHAGEGIRSHRLAVKGGIDRQQLYLVFVYSSNIDSAATVEFLAAAIKQDIRSLIGRFDASSHSKRYRADANHRIPL